MLWYIGWIYMAAILFIHRDRSSIRRYDSAFQHMWIISSRWLPLTKKNKIEYEGGGGGGGGQLRGGIWTDAWVCLYY